MYKQVSRASASLTNKMHCLLLACLQLGRLQRDARLSSDEQHAIQGHIEDMTDRHIADLDGLVEEKAKDLCKP